MGANVNIKTADGRLMLHLATFAGDYDFIKLFADNGAKFTINDRNGNSPIEAVMNTGKIDRFKTVLLHQTTYR